MAVRKLTLRPGRSICCEKSPCEVNRNIVNHALHTEYVPIIRRKIQLYEKQNVAGTPAHAPIPYSGYTTNCFSVTREFAPRGRERLGKTGGQGSARCRRFAPGKQRGRGAVLWPGHGNIVNIVLGRGSALHVSASAVIEGYLFVS